MSRTRRMTLVFLYFLQQDLGNVSGPMPISKWGNIAFDYEAA